MKPPAEQLIMDNRNGNGFSGHTAAKNGLVSYKNDGWVQLFVCTLYFSIKEIILFFFQRLIICPFRYRNDLSSGKHHYSFVHLFLPLPQQACLIFPDYTKSNPSTYLLQNTHLWNKQIVMVFQTKSGKRPQILF